MRHLLDDALEARFALGLGDRPMVALGATVTRRRPARRAPPGPADRGGRGPGAAGRRPGSAPDAGRSLVAARRRQPHPARRRPRGRAAVAGPRPEGPLADRDRRPSRHRASRPSAARSWPSTPGGELRLRVAGRALRGAFSAGSPARGRLELATDPFGDLRPGGIDVGRAGSILVVGARIDAEALTRARAMGVRGIVVASLPGKDLRDFRASERRQRASLHQSPPFGVLVLDGTARRAIPTPVAGLLERLAGREVSLLIDPPALVFDARRRRPAGDRARLGARPVRDPRRERGPARRARRPAPVRARRPARGGARRHRRAGADSHPDRGPRAPRLTSGSATLGAMPETPLHRTRRGQRRRRDDPRARGPPGGRRPARATSCASSASSAPARRSSRRASPSASGSRTP